MLASMASALALMAPLASPPVHTSFTLAASGDLLIHQPVWVRARADGGGHYDFRPMLRYLKPIIAKADVALCHIETPMSDRPPASYPMFNTPSALARAVKWAGWDVCGTASNHSLDQGQAGVDSTGVALRRAGVLHTGSFRSAAAQRRITMLTVRGVKVALLAYTEMTNGIALPHPWSVNLARAGTIRADARRARAQGAQVVVVNIHWGDEYHSRPSAFQRRLAGAIMRGHLVTALVGQHVHVVQPIARVHGRLVVYGEGNLLSNQGAACCSPETQDGLIALLRISVDGQIARVTHVTYVPTFVRHPDFAVLPIRIGLQRGFASIISTLRMSWRRTVARAGRVSGVTPDPARAPDLR